MLVVTYLILFLSLFFYSLVFLFHFLNLAKKIEYSVIYSSYKYYKVWYTLYICFMIVWLGEIS